MLDPFLSAFLCWSSVFSSDIYIIFFSFYQIFNSKLVLASPETATDADYAAILGVIGHEVCNY